MLLWQGKRYLNDRFDMKLHCLYKRKILIPTAFRLLVFMPPTKRLVLNETYLTSNENRETMKVKIVVVSTLSNIK